jgi:hypothetical protein
MSADLYPSFFFLSYFLPSLFSPPNLIKLESLIELLYSNYLRLIIICMSRQFFRKINTLLERWELKGHKAANTIHRWTINCVLLFMAYNIYGIMKGYNDSFLELRVRGG